MGYNNDIDIGPIFVAKGVSYFVTMFGIFQNCHNMLLMVNYFTKFVQSFFFVIIVEGLLND